MEPGSALDDVCAKSDDIVSREIEGDIVIVPLVAGIGDAEGELYTLNGTGRAIWERIDGQSTLAQVVAGLADEYEVTPDELESDVLGFTDELVRRGILTVRS